MARETLIKSNSPRSNAHTHAAEFDTLRFNQRVPGNAEDVEQITLFRWRDMFSGRYPELLLMHHIPNGGSRNKAEAAKLKRMGSSSHNWRRPCRLLGTTSRHRAGVKAGVPDIFLPVPRNGRHGLYIELKAGKNTATKEQREFIEDVKSLGYDAEVCRGWEEAAAAILQYLTGKAVSAEDIAHSGGSIYGL